MTTKMPYLRGGIELLQLVQRRQRLLQDEALQGHRAHQVAVKRGGGKEGGREERGVRSGG